MLAPFEQDIQKFITSFLDDGDHKGVCLDKVTPSTVTAPGIDTPFSFQRDQNGLSSVAPCCPFCGARVFWNLPFCPYCHQQVPNLAALRDNTSNIIASLKGTSYEKIEKMAATTGKIIFQDADVTITDRDLAQAKREVKKYMPTTSE
jgi:thiol-disulfide isomerase/thioredoxin